MGYRGRRGRYPGNGPFSDLPPWQRPGQVYGYGAGRGYAADPAQCARFPWLPRWWWANPENQRTPQSPPVPSSGGERELLESQISYLERELEEIRKRL
jgi:hypothetical protein